MAAKLGPYRLITRMGQGGGGGVVYRARLRGVDYALKVPGAWAQVDEARDQLLHRELQVQRQLQAGSDRIVQIHDFGESVEGLWVAFELMPGGSIRDLLTERATPQSPGCLTPGELVTLLTDLNYALSHVHNAQITLGDGSSRVGVLHRDIKPENILLDGAGRCKLSDFGLAKSIAGGMTRTTGAFPGTPPYMSPEQLDDTLRLGPASDVWQLAVNCYEMLSGQLPFGPDHIQNADGQRTLESPTRVIQRIQNPAFRLPRPTSHVVSDAVWRIFESALHRDPARRPASVAVFVHQMIGALDGAPQPLPVRAQHRERPLLRRRMTQLQKVAAVLVLVWVGLVAAAGTLYYLEYLAPVEKDPRKSRQEVTTHLVGAGGSVALIEAEVPGIGTDFRQRFNVLNDSVNQVWETKLTRSNQQRVANEADAAFENLLALRAETEAIQEVIQAVKLMQQYREDPASVSAQRATIAAEVLETVGPSLYGRFPQLESYVDENMTGDPSVTIKVEPSWLDDVADLKRRATQISQAHVKTGKHLLDKLEAIQSELEELSRDPGPFADRAARFDRMRRIAQLGPTIAAARLEAEACLYATDALQKISDLLTSDRIAEARRQLERSDAHVSEKQWLAIPAIGALLAEAENRIRQKELELFGRLRDSVSAARQAAYAGDRSRLVHQRDAALSLARNLGTEQPGVAPLVRVVNELSIESGTPANVAAQVRRLIGEERFDDAAKLIADQQTELQGLIADVETGREIQTRLKEIDEALREDDAQKAGDALAKVLQKNPLHLKANELKPTVVNALVAMAKQSYESGATHTRVEDDLTAIERIDPRNTIAQSLRNKLQRLANAESFLDRNQYGKATDELVGFPDSDPRYKAMLLRIQDARSKADKTLADAAGQRYLSSQKYTFADYNRYARADYIRATGFHSTGRRAYADSDYASATSNYNNARAALITANHKVAAGKRNPPPPPAETTAEPVVRYGRVRVSTTETNDLGKRKEDKKYVLTFSLKNEGTADLVVKSISAQGDYEISSSKSGTLRPGQSMDFSVGLLTNSPGSKSGSVVIATNTGDVRLPFSHTVPRGSSRVIFTP